tara:strand:+ start:417 stop:716 length:300 start_codon:yes stop_codon:yes gene_type:complete
MDRIAIFEGYYVAALEWGHYARLDRMTDRGFSISPMRDTHSGLLAHGTGDDAAHRAYHYASRVYGANRYFDPYNALGPAAQHVAPTIRQQEVEDARNAS